MDEALTGMGVETVERGVVKPERCVGLDQRSNGPETFLERAGGRRSMGAHHLQALDELARRFRSLAYFLKQRVISDAGLGQNRAGIELEIGEIANRRRRTFSAQNRVGHDPFADVAELQ